MDEKKIGLVVVGRNAKNQLKEIYDIEYINTLRENFEELIYVDSDSSDGSDDEMTKYGFQVIKIESNQHSASLGRKIGTLNSRSDYICYLDSDMKLFNVDKVKTKISKIEEQKYCGYVGDVIDIYPNGQKRLRARKIKKEATSFGGFVLIKKDDVIKSGNWSDNLVANEELDLYIRLKKNNCKILYDKNIYVEHHTIKSSKFQELFSLYFPMKNPRKGSLGRVLKKQRNMKSIFIFFSLQRELVYYFISILAFIVSLEVALIILFVSFILVTNRRSWKYNFVIPGLIISLFTGIVMSKKKVIYKYEKN